MTKYSSKDIVIEYDNSGGVLQNITQHVLTINGLSKEAILQQSESFGDSWEEHFSTGIKRMGEVVLGGMYDDQAATGPNALFDDVGSTTERTLKVTIGGTKTVSVETLNRRYDRNPVKGGMTMYEVALQPTGAVTET